METKINYKNKVRKSLNKCEKLIYSILEELKKQSFNTDSDQIYFKTRLNQVLIMQNKNKESHNEEFVIKQLMQTANELESNLKELHKTITNL